MRKSFIALAIVIVGLLTALFLLNQQPKYAGVSLPNKDYQHIQDSKQQIIALLSDLKAFDYKKTTTLTAVEKNANELYNLNQKRLGQHDQEQMKTALHGENGIVTVTKNAVKGQYNIDPSVASTLHGDFETLIIKSTSAVNKSSAQRESIINQLLKEINLDQSLYQIGHQHE